MAERPARPRRRRSLARRLTQTLVLTTVLPLLVVGAALIWVGRDVQIQHITSLHREVAEEVALTISSYLDNARNVLRVFAQTHDLMALDPSSQQAVLQEVLLSQPGVFEDVALLDRSGQEVARVSRFHTFLPDELTSRAETEAFRQAIQGQVYTAGEARISPYSSLPVMTMAVPVLSRGGESAGVLVAEVSLKAMWDAVAHVKTELPGYAYIVNRQGHIVGHTRVSRYFQLQQQSLDFIPLVEALVAGQKPTPRLYRGLEGERVVGVLAPVEGTPWSVIVEVPTREAFVGLRRMIYLLIGTLVVAMLVAGGLGALLPRRIIRPLRLLQEGAAAIGAGRLEHVIRVRTNDELEDLAEAFNAMAARLRESRAQLERWGQEMERQVEERTAELAEASERLQRRAGQFQAIAEVGRTITLVGDLDRMLTEITQRISEHFGFYHVGVFLLDEAGEYAVLRAANSEGGQRMLARGHRLKVGETGIVGYVTSTGEPRIALDVGEDAVWFDNPDLPLTRSELALPLKVGDEIIGALDVQSTEEAAFTEEDVTVLSVLADQVAVAIQNARLLAQTQQALAEVEETHRQYLRREWREITAQRGPLVYEYARTGTPPLREALLPEMKRAIERGEVVAMPISDGDGGGGAAVGSALAVPIKLRGQVIGVIDLQEIGNGRQWTEDEIALVRAISDQMALAAENVRLLEETERRAAWEHQVQAITSRIRRSPDLATILQTTVEELGRVLGADRALVRLKVGSQGTDQALEE